MSSNMSDTGPRHFLRGRRRAAAILGAVGFLLALGGAVGSVWAGEATARGKKATITWIDAQGNRQQADARKILYGYVIRRYLQVPRGGKNFKDETHEEKGLPFADGFINFTQIDRIEFNRRTDPDTGVSQLLLKVTMPNGKERTGSAASLAGASHLTSPYIAFTVDDVLHTIDLNPLASEAECAGKPRLVSVVFYL